MAVLPVIRSWADCSNSKNSDCENSESEIIKSVLVPLNFTLMLGSRAVPFVGALMKMEQGMFEGVESWVRVASYFYSKKSIIVNYTHPVLS